MNHGIIRLFYLEDDDNDALLMDHALKRSGRPVVLHRFENPLEAIRTFNCMSAPEVEAPHLILSDLKMPMMNGIEFTSWLRQSRFACLPIIIFTGSSMPNDVLDAYRCGANSFATKPLNAHQLNETIGTVLRYWNDVCDVRERSRLAATHGCGPITASHLP